MKEKPAFYELTCQNGRRFAEVYLGLRNDDDYMNILYKAILTRRLLAPRYRRRRLMDRCYWEQRQKHNSKRR